MTDVDRLPPTQYLILEILAARYRLGEEIWPFPTTVAGALSKLEHAGLIQRMSGTTPKTIRALFTEAGKQVALSESYKAPNGGVERPRQALRLIAEFASQRADLVPGMGTIAEIARAGLVGEPS